MRVTIKDIAKASGSSITTVSLVLNNKAPHISEETRSRIKTLARSLGYRPNRVAINLQRQSTKTIGLIIPDINNSFFAELIGGVESASQQSGYDLLLTNSNDRQKDEIQHIQALADRSVDGLIVVMSAESHGLREQESFQALHDTGVPTVLLDCFSSAADFSTVTIDNSGGAELAVDHLIKLGHRRIACVSGPRGPVTNEDRLTGYSTALERAGIKVENELIVEGDFRYQSGYAAAQLLLPHKPSAIFCLNDLMAYGVVRALRERKIKIPKDISVVGFDDIFFSSVLEVPLTTVRQSIGNIGETAANVLINEVQDKTAEKRHIVLPPQLVVRKSTGIAK